MKINELHKTFVAWLKKPLAFVTESPVEKFYISLFFGLFVFVFLLIFQPFGLDAVAESKIFYLFAFGFATFIIFFLNLFFFPYLLPRFFDSDNWNILKNILFSLFNILIISYINWLLSCTIGKSLGLAQHSLLRFLFITGSVGIFPTLLFSYFMEKKMWQRNNAIAKKISEHLGKDKLLETDKNEPEVIINLKTGKNTLHFVATNLLCVVSEGNYANVFYLHENKLKKQLIRSTLKKLETQFINLGLIVRCHKSYIVNLAYVIRISGNARAYNLHIQELNFLIPVSRSQSTKLIDLINRKK